EISACKNNANGTGEWVEIRNDSGAAVTMTNYTVYNSTAAGATGCFTFNGTLAPGGSVQLSRNTTCLADTGGTAGPRVGDTTPAAIADQHTYSNCGTTVYRSVRDCAASAWTDTTATGYADDNTNNTCHPESVEIRNDTPSSVTATGWTVRNGS